MTSPTFFKNSKDKFDRKYDIFGAIIIANFLREKEKSQSISTGYRAKLICELRREKSNFVEDLISKYAEPSFESLENFEIIFNLQINIWCQKTLSDVPYIVRESNKHDWYELNVTTKDPEQLR